MNIIGLPPSPPLAISCTVLESVKMISATHRKVYQTLRNAFLRCLVIITYLFQLIRSRNTNMTNVKSADGVNYKLQEEIHEIPPDDHHDKCVCLVNLIYEQTVEKFASDFKLTQG